MAGALHGDLQGEGRGFEFGSVAPAQLYREQRGPPKVFQKSSRMGSGLIGDQGQGVASGMQRAQAVGHAGIGHSEIEQMSGIGRRNLCRSEIGIDRRTFKRADGEHPRAIADIGDDFFQ